MRSRNSWWKPWAEASVWAPLLWAALISSAANAASPPVALVSGATDFGTQDVGVSSTATLTFNFSRAASMVTPLVVTQGVTGQDFQSSGGTCATGTWDAGFSCTVQVTFKPLYPGLRMGAVVFAGGGSVLAATYLQGVGNGPMPTLASGVTTISPPLVPITVAVDPGGTLYLGGQSNVNGQQARGVFLVDGTDIGDGFSGVDEMAIDGAGNIYVSDHQSNCVWITTPAFPYISRTTTCWSPPTGVSVAGPMAVDGNGSLYIGDLNSGSVLRFSSDGGQATAAVCGSGLCVLSGFTLAVDGAENLYLATVQGGSCYWMNPISPTAASCNGAVWKIPPSAAANQAQWIKIWQGTGGGYWSTTHAVSVAVDGVGTVYIVDSARKLWKAPPGSSQALVDTTDLGLEGWSPWYVAVDGPENAYVTDSSRLALYKLAGINFIGVTVTANGVCGSANGQTLTTAPTNNLCSVGASTALTGSGPWTWTCLGSNGGAAASCNAQIPPTSVNGACGTANGGIFSALPTANLCSAGYASPLPVNGSGPWSWVCGGFNGGSASPVCTANLAPGAVNGACSGANGLAFNAPPANLCSVGAASAITGSSTGPWSWSCLGYNNGSKASCSTASASAACTSGTSSTVASGITPTGVGVDGADNVYYSYSQCDPYCGAYISEVGGGPLLPEVMPDYLLGSWAAYGDGELDYTIDTVPFQNGNRGACSGGYGPIAVDASGRLYAYSSGSVVVPGCTTSNGAGVDTVIAGGGSGCASQTDLFGDGCPATSAWMSGVVSLAVDTAGNLYIADYHGVNIRKVDAVSNVITAVAWDPCDTTVVGTMAVDRSGYLYFADGGQIFRVDTVAGGLNPASRSICKALSISGLKHAVGVALDSRGNLYVADSGLSAVIRVAGVAAESCGGLTPVSGYCGDAAYFATSAPKQQLCSSGASSPVVGSSAGPWTWSCVGQSYGGNTVCGTYPAVLTVSATGTLVQGNSPAFTPIYSGWVNNDTAYDVLDGSPAFSTAATATSLPGNYPITVSRGTLDSDGYYNYSFVPGTLSVVAAPKVQLSVTAAVTKQAGAYRAVVTIANSGNADAPGVSLTTAALGSATGSPLPQNPGAVKAGGSATMIVTFPLSAGASGLATVAKFAGTYTGGSFSSSIRVTLP